MFTNKCKFYKKLKLVYQFNNLKNYTIKSYKTSYKTIYIYIYWEQKTNLNRKEITDESILVLTQYVDINKRKIKFDNDI